MQSIPLVGACALLASLASAQSFTIADGNMQFGWGGNATNGGYSPADVATGSSCNNSSNLYAWHWSYSFAGSNAGTPLDDRGHGNYTQTVGANAATQTILDVDRQGLVDIVTVDTVRSSGPNSGYVEHSLTITNRVGSPVAMKLYLFVDPDLNDTLNFSMPEAASDRFLVGSLAPCGGCFELWADSPDFYHVGEYSDPDGPNDRITAGADLPNTGLPFASFTTPGDFTGAFQWSMVIEPGASRTFFATTGHNDVRSGAPASQSRLGTALGSLTLQSTPGVIGQGFTTLSVDGGGAATSAVVFFGVDGAPVLQPFAGLSVMFPASGILAFVDVPLVGGSGNARLVIDCLPQAVGAPLALQAFALDAASPAQLPIVHSDVLIVVLGD